MLASIAPADLVIAAEVARRSGHPLSRAIAAAAPAGAAALSDVREHPGLGIEGRPKGRLYRLGRAEWALAAQEPQGRRPVRCSAVTENFWPALLSRRRCARRQPAAIDALRADGIEITLLSGDTPAAVNAVAARLGIGTVAAGRCRRRRSSGSPHSRLRAARC